MINRSLVGVKGLKLSQLLVEGEGGGEGGGEGVSSKRLERDFKLKFPGLTLFNTIN